MESLLYDGLVRSLYAHPGSGSYGDGEKLYWPWGNMVILKKKGFDWTNKKIVSISPLSSTK